MSCSSDRPPCARAVIGARPAAASIDTARRLPTCLATAAKKPVLLMASELGEDRQNRPADLGMLALSRGIDEEQKATELGVHVRQEAHQALALPHRVRGVDLDLAGLAWLNRPRI